MGLEEAQRFQLERSMSLRTSFFSVGTITVKWMEIPRPTLKNGCVK